MKTSLCPFCLKMVHTKICPYCGSDVNYPGYPNHLPVGYTLTGRMPYVIGAARGQGGFGITYIALDMTTNQRVAIKEYYPNHCCGRNNSTYVYPSFGQEEAFTKGKQHFLEEAQILYQLSNIDSIVKVLDYFEANNSAYLVMEFLDGISLKDYVENQGQVSASIILQQMKPLMKDMARMHSSGVIHRDIAPDNIIMLPDGGLKLIDFGAARSYLGDKSMSVVVKKGFAPVEQYMSKGSNVSADVYALAATIYYCLTGVIPPDSAERQFGEAVLTAPTQLGADLTPQQEYALEKALELQPKDRIQSVDELFDQLFAVIPKPNKRQIIYDDHRHMLQEDCPVMLEHLQLIYDYDKNTAIVRPVMRCLTNDRLLTVTAELLCDADGETRSVIARFEIPCKNIKRNEFFGNESPINLPLGELRGVCLTIVSVVYENGVRSNCGSDCEEVTEQERLENYFGGDVQVLKQYRLDTLSEAVWKPICGQYYWRCNCGNLNLQAELTCSRCQADRENQFAALDLEKLAIRAAVRQMEETQLEEQNNQLSTVVEHPSSFRVQWEKTSQYLLQLLRFRKP